MIEWWNSLGFALQVFYCIAIPSTLVLFIQTILMFIGMDDDIGGSSDIGSQVDSGIAGDGVFGEDSITETPDTWGLVGLRIFTARAYRRRRSPHFHTPRRLGISPAPL